MNFVTSTTSNFTIFLLVAAIVTGILLQAQAVFFVRGALGGLVILSLSFSALLAVSRRN
jgi:hypothetical protein